MCVSVGVTGVWVHVSYTGTRAKTAGPQVHNLRESSLSGRTLPLHEPQSGSLLKFCTWVPLGFTLVPALVTCMCESLHVWVHESACAVYACAYM